jgi:lipid-A-disaccharide synthase|tara:strand:+ start:150 stop:1283 length:1134 start_codon:yes stop_codon:yes gene_type:complete
VLNKREAKMKKYFIIAGEPSGDLHGSKLIRAIKNLHPNSSFMGHGGNKMKNEGMRIIEHIDDLSIMGFTEVLRHLPRLIKIMDATLNAISQSNPDRIILIDYPGFNLRLAKKLSSFDIPITYFILPQVWAWKEKRVKKMKKLIDQTISIFPFEKDWFASRGLNVEYFGHPFMDIEHMDETTKSFYKRHSLDLNSPILTLLPGSRQQEIDRHWPIFLETVNLLREQYLNLQVVVGKASNIDLDNCPSDFKIERDAKKAMLVGTVGLVSSGTATLECAIEGLPIVVCYKLFPLSWFITKTLVKVKHSSIINIIMDKQVVPELLQDDMNPKLILKTIAPLFDMESEKRKKMFLEYEKLKKSLGSPGVYMRVAESILEKTT